MIHPRFTLGDWLNLIARLPRDADLASLVDPINKQFAAALKREADSQLRRHSRSFESGQAVESYRRCDRIAGLIKHLEPEIQSTTAERDREACEPDRDQARADIQTPQGTFVFGSQSSYVSDLMPILVEALEAKGYLPDQAVLPLA